MNTGSKKKFYPKKLVYWWDNQKIHRQFHQNSFMAKKIRKVLSITGGIISGMSMIAVFNNANAISNQTLNTSNAEQGNYMLSLFVNIAITFIVGGISLKFLIDDMDKKWVKNELFKIIPLKLIANIFKNIFISDKRDKLSIASMLNKNYSLLLQIAFQAF